MYYLYAARLIQGVVTAGTFSFGQIYLVEISSDRYGIYKSPKMNIFRMRINGIHSNFGAIFNFNVCVCFSVRGACGSIMLLAVNFGMVVAFTIGTYFSYHVPPLFAIAINVLFVALFLAFHETPLFLMKQNRMPVCVFIHFNIE